MALEFDKELNPRIPRIDLENSGNENSENYDSNYAIAQEISSRIGVEPIPFNSVYDIALAIYRELGGEDEGFDSVYSILLGILPLVEGGGSGKAIEEVDTLPEASENKDRFFRLSSDGNVYVSELKSRTSTTTNRLPDEQQIDKAYIYESLNIDGIYYYKGAWKIILNDGEVECYGWLAGVVEEDDWYLYLTKENAVNTTINTKAIYTNDGIINLENHSVTINDVVASFDLDNADTLEDNGVYPVSATYNAPEANQIGNATAVVDGNIYWYTGEIGSIVVDEETITGYKWQYEDDVDDYTISTKPASKVYYHIGEGEYEGIYYTDTKMYYDGTDFSTSTTYSIPQLNAPDSEQVDNAYIIAADYNGDDLDFYYTGREVTLVGTNGSFTGYVWDNGNDNAELWISNITCNNIYATSDNPNITIWMQINRFDFSSNEGDWWTGTVFTSNTHPIEFGQIYGTSPSYDDFVKYQRTEVTEEWAWKSIDYQPMQSITYAELKSLRDNKQLVPGQQYRITDYQATSSDASTSVAGHQFDIIVTADAEDKLNENARAINHPYDLISAIIIDSESNYLYRRYPEGDDDNGYAWAYCQDESSYPTIDEYIDEGFTFSNIDTGDLVYTNSETPAIGSLTMPNDYDIVDFSNTINPDYFANSKLESWELKYCLDNDSSRFSWADASTGKGVIFSMKDEFNNQAYFDYKNIKIFEENYGDYCYLFRDDDTYAANHDGTISGVSYNNTIAGEVSDGVLTLDTSKLFFNSYDYNNLIPTVKEIPVEFGITVDASMKPTAITESSTGEYSADDMKDDSFNGAKVHARFAFETSQGGMTVTVLRYLEGVLNNEKIEMTVGEQVISTEIIPTMVFHKSNEVWTVWYDNVHSSWKITVNQ